MSLSISLLVTLIISLPLFLIGILALNEKLRSIYKPLKEREFIYFCSNCGHVYAVSNRRPMNACPRCKQLNEAININ